MYHCIDASYTSDFLHNLRVLLFLIKFNILISIVTCRQKNSIRDARTPQPGEIFSCQARNKRVLASRFNVLLNGAKAKGCQRRCFDMCCAAQHAEDTPRWTRQGTNPSRYIAAIANEQVLYVPDENYRNPSREAKHQPDLLKDCFNHLGWA